MPTKKTTEELVGERPSADEVSKLPRTPISIIVDNVRSLDNVGLLFRLSELARIEHLYLAGYTGYPEKEGDDRSQATLDRHHSRINKTAVYAVPHQPWSHVADPVPLVQDLKGKGYQIVSLEQTTNSKPYHQVDYTLPIAFIIGHERQGVRQELIDLSDQVVEIPIHGLGNSHNVAMSCGIVLYHILEKTNQI